MDSDILLKDDGTAEVTGDRFKTSVGDIEMYYRGGHLKTANGMLELTSDSNTLKLSASNCQMYYSGGHLLTKDSGVELGSTDRGALRGFSQSKDGTVTVTGDKATMWAGSVASIQADEVRIEGNAAGKTVAKLNVQSPAVQLGSQAADRFLGIHISPKGLSCFGPGVSVLNPALPNVNPNQRLALSQDEEDTLVVNAGVRYSNGVKVEGQLAMSTAGKLVLLRPDRTVTDPRTGKTVRFPVPPMDVLQTLVALQQSVQDLTNRLAELEAKVKEPTPS